MIADRWMLMDEEMRDIVGEDIWNYIMEKRVEFQTVAVMQDARTKRKLVEWIDSMGEYSLDFPVDIFKIPKHDWQALREEVGLDR